ncbi:histidine kinase [Frateuria sp. Soil773]|uniref:sensor histidine kinase n=1 Tax=Frateuria sp. Soil773 TaxID=1736407 RepID=UPI0006F98B7A|nr:cache domain-containing protein [Frateuria sp. Soil773]KRE89009.1 histidine kinase [Frateuria sp. Soil773]
MQRLADIAPRLHNGRHSVRYRLLAIALLPMLVILPLLLAASLYSWNSKFDATLVSKASDDLTIAHQYFGRLQEAAQAQLVSMADSARLRDLLRKDDDAGASLAGFLREAARERGFDFLYIVGSDGRIVASGHPLASTSVRWNWPVVHAALEGRAKTAVDVFQPAELSAISPALAQRARIGIVPTAGSAPGGAQEEARGMLLHSASAVVLPDGMRGALVGGMLLNGNLSFVDSINDLIYHGSGSNERSRGTVTLFLGDVRISTNVRLFGDQRAIGTRVSTEVEHAVLGQGKTWLGSAFVVDDRYMSGYEPILDSYGQRAGMLYAGFLERPYAAAKRRTLLEIALAFLVAAAATVPIFLTWAAEIFRPLERMAATIGRIEDGQLEARTGRVENEDEIGQVSRQLDRLLDQVQERDRQLRRWNDELNRRVEERTGKLRLANQQLEATTRKLVMSEKLAAIGEITAGVAHEINNPVAVMQGNLEVIRELLGRQADVARTEFGLIEEQLRRIGEIVNRLLQFARPQEYAGSTPSYAPAEVVDDTLPLVQHLLNKTAIALEREYRASRPVAMNRTELQQVLVNLMVNAIHAMPAGGRLTLRTFDRDEDGQAGVVIEVGDTGAGMVPDVMQKVFDPFFTTKRREGTGLGLSISQMLVSRLGGMISVQSEPGQGTVFSVWLPVSDNGSPAAQDDEAIHDDGRIA